MGIRLGWSILGIFNRGKSAETGEVMIEISKKTVGQITAEEFMNLNQEQRDDVLFLMTDMQRRLLKVRLTTWESRKTQEVFQKRRRSARYTQASSNECIGMCKIDERYVLSGGSPVEIARRIRELCCKKIAQVAAQQGIDPQKELDRFSKYDRDATLVSNMRTVAEVLNYLRERGYSAKNESVPRVLYQRKQL